jgi:uncharacterized protein YraI
MNLLRVQPGRSMRSARVHAYLHPESYSRLPDQVAGYDAGQTMIRGRHTGRQGMVVHRSPGMAIRARLARMGAGQDATPVDVGTPSYGTKADASTSTALGSTATAALPSPNAQAASAQQVQVTAASGANLRSGAGTDKAIIVGEPNGTILTNLGQYQNGWINVSDPNGQSGWVYSAYVTGLGGAITPSYVGTPSDTPSVLGSAGGTVAAATSGSGLLGVAVVGGALIAAYYLMIK